MRVSEDEHKEDRMEIVPVAPMWLTWTAAGIVAALGLAALVRGLEALLDLEAR